LVIEPIVDLFVIFFSDATCPLAASRCSARVHFYVLQHTPVMLCIPKSQQHCTKVLPKVTGITRILLHCFWLRMCSHARFTKNCSYR